MICCRCSGVMGPIWLCGGQTNARSTMPGVPFSSRKETSASPTASSVITVSTFSFGIRAEGLGRRLHGFLIAGREGAERVLHAVAELAEHVSGTSSGFWVTK